MPRAVRVSILTLVAAGVLCQSLALGRSCGPPPKAKPHRWTGGESFPPLPLPVTPLRRSEKKRPPAPPALMGKVQYGELVSGVDEDGKKYSYRDWTTAAGDMQGLLTHVNSVLNIKYRGVHTTFKKFSYNPAELPILYLTGSEGFELSDEVRKKLRWYLQDGGTLLCDARSGSDDYLKSWVKEITRIFPHKKTRRLPEDHPIYNCFYKIDEVGYAVEGKKPFRDKPVLLGVNIGCRTAVVLTPYGLSCPWDGHKHDYGKFVWPREDALKLGSNIIAYTLAHYELGRYLATQKVYFEEGEEGADRFTFAQVIHGGDWDPTPGAAMNLLKCVEKDSTMDVKFKRAAVDLSKADVFKYPFLYMTGLHDFRLTDGELASLRRYLKNGGILFADSCCGRKHFDAAFRREIARVIPGAKLSVVPSSHEIYSAAGDRISSVDYKPMVIKAKGKDFHALPLEGISIGGTLAVIYSRYDLGCGWMGVEVPYCVGVAPKDSMRLARSILVYAMTH